MTWLSLIELIFGDYSVLILAALSYLIGLGIYKLLKDWLPF